MSITKNGLWTSSTFTNFLAEPDETVWMHIFHHNNPSVNLFTSSDTFTTGVYKSDDLWYDVERICGAIDKWEFILKQKDTATSAEVKYRWVQGHNPNTATWDNVKPSSTTITRITTTGYSTSTVGGGIYRANSSTRMVIANSSNGNWFGAVGCWTAYNGGIPGFPNTTCTTGCMDLYIRIDNTILTETNKNIVDIASIGKGGTMAPQFIEI